MSLPSVLKRRRTLSIFIAVLSLFLLIFSFKDKFLARASSTSSLITFFDIDPAGAVGIGHEDATYIVKFQFLGENFAQSGEQSAFIQLQLRREGDYAVLVDNPTATMEYFKVDGTDESAQVGDLQIEVPENTGYVVYTIPHINTDIPKNTEVEIKLTGVKNPDLEGMFAFYIVARDGNNTYFNMDGSADTVMEYLGEPCAKVKVTNPAGDTPAREAVVYLHSFDWYQSGTCYTDYNGMCAFYHYNFYSLDSCPTGNYYLDADPSYADSSTYARVNDVAVSLPGDATRFTGENPLKLGGIQVVGHLIDGVTSESLSSAEVSVAPLSFSSFDDFRFGSSDENGDFSLGGITEGDYVLEFMLPWDGVTSDITIPDSIAGVEVRNDLKIKIPGYCDTFVTQCDLGDINYPEAVKTITGTVTDESGNPVTNGSVEIMEDMGMSMRQVNIDENGEYSVAIGGGTFTVMPIPSHVLGGSSLWTYCGMPKFISFAKDNTVESKAANFTVKKATVTVNGSVVQPNGSTPFTSGGVEVRSKDGCGSWSPIDSQGDFSVTVPPGTYTVSVMPWSDSLTFGAPSGQTVSVNSTNSPFTMSPITMVEKKDTITGRVWADLNGNGSYDSGEGRESVRVEAFKMSKKFDEFVGGPGPGGGSFVSAQTDSNGSYSFKVTPGMWMVNVMLDPAMMGGYSSTEATYIYTGAPLQVNVTSSDNGNTYSNKNFEVVLADATINGVIVDENGNNVDGIYGFSFADSGTGPMMGMGMGAPIQDGTFKIKVPAGTYEVGVDFPPDSTGYTSAGSVSVTATSGETVSAEVVVKPNNKRIKVNLVDSDGNAVTGLNMMDLFAESSTGAHVFKMLYGSDLASGSTLLNVCEGTWKLGYFIDPGENNYMSEPLTKDTKVTVTSEHTAENPAEVNVVLREANAAITGKVTAPNGDALSGVWISTDNRKVSDFDMSGPMFMRGEVTDDNGNYTLELPAGKYKVQAFLPPSMGYINPQAREVNVAENETKTANLQFGSSDAVISGTVTLDGSAKGAFITAYSDNGGYSESTTFDGPYSLNVTKSDTWYVKAMYESGENYYRSDLYEVVMEGSTSKTQDLALEKANFTIPTAVSSTFDYQNAKRISLSNGFVLSIPAGAISPGSNANGNNITVTVSPTAQLSSQSKAIPVGVGYDITATDDTGSVLTSNFNSPVTITIPYNSEYLTDALGGMDETLLDNAYWDDSTSTWRGINGATIDTENNTLSFTINHFTTFSILSGSDPDSTVTTISSDDSSDDSDGDIGTDNPFISVVSIGGSFYEDGKYYYSHPGGNLRIFGKAHEKTKVQVLVDDAHKLPVSPRWKVEDGDVALWDYVLYDTEPGREYKFDVYAFNKKGKKSDPVNFYVRIGDGTGSPDFITDTSSILRSENVSLDQFSDCGDVYTVVSGDSLWSIAQEKYGDGSLYTLVRDFNNLGDVSLSIGDELNIPCQEEGTQAVASPDSSKDSLNNESNTETSETTKSEAGSTPEKDSQEDRVVMPKDASDSVSSSDSGSNIIWYGLLGFGILGFLVFILKKKLI